MSNPSDNPILMTLELRPGEETAGISLAVGEGEIVAIRSDPSRVALLLRCLAGAETSVDGQLWINGVAVHLLGWDARVRLSRTRCAVLLGTDRLLPELSVTENVALPLLLAGVRLSQARRRATDWLARLEAEEFASQKPKALSFAAYRRVSIARSLVTDPALLFIDEPLADLDAADRRHLLRILRASAGPHRLTLVVTTQDAEVLRWADRAIPVYGDVSSDAAVPAGVSAVSGPLLVTAVQR